MANINGSFASLVADAHPTSLTTDPTGWLMSVYSGITSWTALFALFLVLVAYDQGKPFSSSLSPSVWLATSDQLMSYPSEIYMAQGFHRGAAIQDPVYGAILA